MLKNSGALKIQVLKKIFNDPGGGGLSKVKNSISNLKILTKVNAKVCREAIEKFIISTEANP